MAQTLAAEIVGLMDSLEPVLEQETTLARTGRLANATGLQTRKAELAAGYITATQRLKAMAPRLSTPARAALAPMGKRHERLRTILQMNMTVVATAHAVAQDLIRGAAAEVLRRDAPQTYGSSGRANEPPARKAGPVVINRNC
jgi:hypothetical protein